MFHDYEQQANGHGNNEWFRRQRDRFRQDSLMRVKTMVQAPDGDPSEVVQANLGIYGLGKRRSLQQLNNFTNMDIGKKKGTFGFLGKCANGQWVPYDASISPVSNLYEKADNLDPQPEYPLRTNLVFYKQPEAELPKIHLDLNKGEVQRVDAAPVKLVATDQGMPGESDYQTSHFGPTLFILWIFGLIVWCVVFTNPQVASKLGSTATGKRPKKKASTKDV